MTDPDPKKDTSALGREEEVITNTEESKQVTNNPQADQNIPDIVDGNTMQPDNANDNKGEKTFKEGLANNSDTITPE